MTLESQPQSPRRFRTWVNYFTHIMHPSSTAASDRPLRPMTRRQQLLEAQELKQRAQREHLLELLREVKDRHQPHV
ncbi:MULTISPECIES: hypothetical protein [Rhodanobacter]|uniref:Uncharacterized protein n=1 Tax=Rhodanobacter hydrolyticus TaxID=2250595 RepID=A0ABW8J2V5_9GAMM|nr:hypothetical protein [Rhodanobacter sp. 7MK24]MBD8879567.1 hypothetical protein [Rhodanobacter sp. 7MK24]